MSNEQRVIDWLRQRGADVADAETVRRDAESATLKTGDYVRRLTAQTRALLIVAAMESGVTFKDHFSPGNDYGALGKSWWTADDGDKRKRGKSPWLALVALVEAK